MLALAGALIGTAGAVVTALATRHPHDSSVAAPTYRVTRSALPVPTPTVSLSPKARVTPSGTAGAAPTLRPACAGPSACGFPSAADTGPGSTTLTPHSGDISIRTNGTVISGWNLSGSLDIYADDVTVVDSKITSTNWWGVNLRPGHTGLRILHSMITALPGKGPDNGGEDYALSNMSDGTVEVGWNDLSVFGNTVSTGHGYIHDNYVHDLVPFINRSGYYQHTDTVISEGGDTTGLRIEHNTLLNPIDVKRGASAAIGLYPDSGPVTDVTIKDNWLAGGAYTLYGGGAGAARMMVSDNVFSDEYWPQSGFYGPIAHWNATGTGNVWSGNTFRDGTEIDAPSN